MVDALKRILQIFRREFYGYNVDRLGQARQNFIFVSFNVDFHKGWAAVFLDAVVQCSYLHRLLLVPLLLAKSAATLDGLYPLGRHRGNRMSIADEHLSLTYLWT